MGLKTLVSRGGYFGRLGAYVRGDHGSYTAVPSVAGWDPICIALTGVVMPYGMVKIPPALGYYDDSGEDAVLDLLRSEPDSHEFDSLRDHQRYGSFLNVVASGIRSLHGEQLWQGVPENERDTHHPSIKGTVRPLLASTDWFSSAALTAREKTGSVGILPAGPGFRALPGGIFQVTAAHQNSLPYHQYWWHPTVNPSWAPRRTVLSTLEDVKSGAYWGVGTQLYYPFSWGGGMYLSLDSFDFESNPGVGVSAHWTFRVTSTNPNEIGTVVWENWFVHTFDSYRTPTAHPPVNGTVGIDNAFSFTEKWRCRCVSTSNPARATLWFSVKGVTGYDSTVTNRTGNRQVPTVLCGPIVAAPSGAMVLDLGKVVKRLSYKTFNDRVSVDMGHIRCSAFQSSSDALSKLQDGLSTNLLEQLAQLKGISEYLPRLSSVVALIRSLRGGVDLTTIGQVIDLAAELRLRYSFQYAPDLDFIISELPRIGKVAATLSKTGVVVTSARGSFDYEFPAGTFGRESCFLETRTKVVVKRDNDSVLAKVLGIDSLGLLPTPSNAWDLIPLSFVLDWFVGLRDRIEVIENNLYLALIGPSYFVHSFRVYSPLTSAELALADVEQGTIPGYQEIAPRFQVYRREVSQRIPWFIHGKYDFLLPSRPPSWMTASALGWTLFASH